MGQTCKKVMEGMGEKSKKNSCKGGWLKKRSFKDTKKTCRVNCTAGSQTVPVWIAAWQPPEEYNRKKKHMQGTRAGDSCRSDSCRGLAPPKKPCRVSGHEKNSCRLEKSHPPNHLSMAHPLVEKIIRCYVIYLPSCFSAASAAFTSSDQSIVWEHSLPALISSENLRSKKMWEKMCRKEEIHILRVTYGRGTKL